MKNTDNDIQKVFTENLKKKMTEKGITQLVIAQKTGASKSIVSRWVDGSRMPQVMNLYRMSRLFECSMDSFFDGYSGGV